MLLHKYHFIFGFFSMSNNNGTYSVSFGILLFQNCVLVKGVGICTMEIYVIKKSGESVLQPFIVEMGNEAVFVYPFFLDESIFDTKVYQPVDQLIVYSIVNGLG